MNDSHFFDTNILAYAFDRSDHVRWKACSRLVKEGFQQEGVSVVSNQVLAELFVVLTGKVAKPVSKDRAGRIVKSFVDSPSWNKVNYDAETVSQVSAYSEKMPNHFWDLLIAETMKAAGVRRIYTENVRDFRGIPWIEPINPMAIESRESRKKGEKKAQNN